MKPTLKAKPMRASSKVPAKNHPWRNGFNRPITETRNRSNVLFIPKEKNEIPKE